LRAKKLEAVLLEKDLILLGKLAKIRLRDFKSLRVVKTVLRHYALLIYLRSKLRFSEMNIL
jgi:hypothetical protein